MATLVYTFPHELLAEISEKMETTAVHFNTGGKDVKMTSIDISDLDNPAITDSEGNVYDLNSLVIDVP